ncbi:MAG TPA: hypothetical protein VF898_00920 [Chloroflexota bacterium]
MAFTIGLGRPVGVNQLTPSPIRPDLGGDVGNRSATLLTGREVDALECAMQGTTIAMWNDGV